MNPTESTILSHAIQALHDGHDINVWSAGGDSVTHIEPYTTGHFAVHVSVLPTNPGGYDLIGNNEVSALLKRLHDDGRDLEIV